MNDHSNPSPAASTLAWYEANADAFVARTQHVTMDDFHQRFLALLPPGGSILEVGAGAGRDARAFAGKGFKVTAMEPVWALAQRLSGIDNVEVLPMRVEDIGFANQFDGVWACASLLHVGQRDLPGVLARLSRALKPGGAFYASFKFGQGETRDRDGRAFLDMDTDAFAKLMADRPEMEVIDMWMTVGRVQRPETRTWFNALARRTR